MTDRVRYFKVVTKGAAPAVAHACRMLRCVGDVVELDGDAVLALLETEMRDEDEGFGVLEAAVRSLSKVTGVVKYGHSGFGTSAFDVARKTEDFVDGLRPEPPKDEADLEDFVDRLRAWRRVRDAVVEAAYDSVKR